MEKFEAKNCCAWPFSIRTVEPPNVKKVAMNFSGLLVMSNAGVNENLRMDSQLLSDRILSCKERSLSVYVANLNIMRYRRMFFV